VKLKWLPVLSNPESKEASSAVTVCCSVPVLVQVTVSPTWTVTVDGANPQATGAESGWTIWTPNAAGARAKTAVDVALGDEVSAIGVAVAVGSTAVATGENLNEIGEFMLLVANEAVDVLNIGSGNSGITGALQIADLAFAFELPVSMMNCPGNFMAHLAAALPNHWMMEVVGAGREKVLRVDNYLEDGWIVLGDKPGLGIEFDEEKIEGASADVPTSGVRAALWGRRRGAGVIEVLPTEPEWPEE
jgi:hypothetical protein